MKKKLEIKEKKPNPLGLTDKEEVVIRCSGCDKPIAIFLLVNKGEINPLTREPLSTIVKVQCCYCNDWSYRQELLGHFYTGGYHVRGETDEDVKPLTEVDHIDIVNDVAIFKARKV